MADVRADVPRRIRAVVVDDEPSAREVVTTLLARHPMIEVVGEATNGRDAVDRVRSLRPDLLFLDIQMPDLDGFAVLAALGAEVPGSVIFVTAHDEHALRAFEVHALDYLLKPFGRPRFDAAVSRVLERASVRGEGGVDTRSLHSTLERMAGDRRAEADEASEIVLDDTSPAPLRRLGVRTGTRTSIVPVESIDWVESLGDYARVHVGPRSHVVSQRMHALERRLESGGFFRVHRSLIVNLQRIRELHRDADGSGSLVLDDGVRLRVARGRWEALQRALEMEEV